MSRNLLLILASLTASALLASAAQASCIPMTAAQQRARADVIFNGRALEGPTATGIQRFRVTRYLKGRGPRIVRVDTMNIRLDHVGKPCGQGRPEVAHPWAWVRTEGRSQQRVWRLTATLEQPRHD
jgi:hypothetical protein